MAREPAAAAEISAIHARLASILDRPPAVDVVEELGRIRARLRELAAEHDELGDPLGDSLGLALPPEAR